jgi:hypothetical protein
MIFGRRIFSPFLLAPEGGAASTGGTPTTAPGGEGGGGAPAAEGGAPENRPLTLADLQSVLAERDKRDAQERHRLNKELQALRRGKATDAPSTEGGEAGDRKPNYVTQDDLAVARRYERALGRLEAAGYDADALADLEDETSEMGPAERARYVEGLLRGLERGASTKTTDNPGTRPEEGRRPRHPAGKGAEPPPAPRGSDVPTTWDDYVALKKKNPERARELLESGQVDLVELNEKRRASARRVDS